MESVAIFRAILNRKGGHVFDGAETVAMLSIDNKGNLRLACRNSKHTDLVDRVLNTIRDGMTLALEKLQADSKRPLRTIDGEIH